MILSTADTKFQQSLYLEHLQLESGERSILLLFAMLGDSVNFSRGYQMWCAVNRPQKSILKVKRDFEEALFSLVEKHPLISVNYGREFRCPHSLQEVLIGQYFDGDDFGYSGELIDLVVDDLEHYSSRSFDYPLYRLAVYSNNLDLQKQELTKLERLSKSARKKRTVEIFSRLLASNFNKERTFFKQGILVGADLLRVAEESYVTEAVEGEISSLRYLLQHGGLTGALEGPVVLSVITKLFLCK